MKISKTLIAAVAGTLLTAAPALAYPGQGSSWDADQSPKNIAVIGDSVVGQAAPDLNALFNRYGQTPYVWPGSGKAPCDFLPDYGSRMSAFNPDKVAFAFVGNATSDCMVAQLGGPPAGRLTDADKARITAIYKNDLTALIRWNNGRGIKTVLVLPMPMAGGTWHGQMTESLTAMYKSFVNGGLVTVTDSTVMAMTNDTGVYQAYAQRDGYRIRIRHTDGTHLTEPYGSVRWATALEEALGVDEVPSTAQPVTTAAKPR